MQHTGTTLTFQNISKGKHQVLYNFQKVIYVMHGKQLTGQYTHVIQIPQFNSPTTQKTANNMENTKRSKTTLGHH